MFLLHVMMMCGLAVQDLVVEEQTRLNGWMEQTCQPDTQTGEVANQISVRRRELYALNWIQSITTNGTTTSAKLKDIMVCVNLNTYEIEFHLNKLSTTIQIL
ncbi:uncharacterized protein LOC128556723 [Mercenaria mercenaria]|uniref:uncharacterized protein LOC128556723 n=1 Tax=Mercenaria mercenaria TaxID=6596 RepID=UPI00234E706B|nr:uncharacterized protein LOC128556723 [Mercenaria mercenaria]